MNIFVTDPDPRICAQVLDDKRLVKMVLETAQIMSTVGSECLSGIEIPYKPTHNNHPCVIWAGESEKNFTWLAQHGWELGLEYYFRFNKEHKSFSIINSMFDKVRWFLPEIDKTPFVNCSNSHSPEENIFEDYKLCLRRKWINDLHEPKWTRRGPPFWAGNYNVLRK